MTFYTDKGIEDICSCLGIKNKALKMEFKELIEHATERYFLLKQTRENKLTDSAEKKKLEQLAKHLNKSKELYSDISEISKGSVLRFYDGLERCKKPFADEQTLLTENSYDRRSLQPQFIKNILSVLEQAAYEALKEPALKFNKANKTELVLSWIYSFSDFWEKYSTVKLVQSKHNSALGRYDSPAIRILYKMGEPLGFGEKSGGSILAEALILYAKNKAEKENSFFKTRGSLFQEE